MDLVTFSEGVQSVRIEQSEHHSGRTEISKPFVPRGEPVVQNTETLFTNHNSLQQLLRALSSTDLNGSVDPWEFDSLADSTQHSLTALALQLKSGMDNELEQLLHQVLPILTELKHDRQQLHSNLSALEKI